MEPTGVGKLTAAQIPPLWNTYGDVVAFLVVHRVLQWNQSKAGLLIVCGDDEHESADFVTPHPEDAGPHARYVWLPRFVCLLFPDDHLVVGHQVFIHPDQRAVLSIYVKMTTQPTGSRVRFQLKAVLLIVQPGVTIYSILFLGTTPEHRRGEGPGTNYGPTRTISAVLEEPVQGATKVTMPAQVFPL